MDPLFPLTPRYTLPCFKIRVQARARKLAPITSRHSSTGNALAAVFRLEQVWGLQGGLVSLAASWPPSQDPGTHKSIYLWITPSNSDAGARPRFEKYCLSTYRLSSLVLGNRAGDCSTRSLHCGALHILCDYSVSSAVRSMLPLFPVPCHTMLNSTIYGSSSSTLKGHWESQRPFVYVVTLVIFSILEIKDEKL